MAFQRLVGQLRDGGLVNEAGLAQETIGDGRGCRGGEHGADVDGHVEQRESAVSLGGVFRVVVQVAYKHLQVALEQARTHGNQEQGPQHEGDAQGIGAGGNGQGQIPGEHDADTGDHALAVANFIGQDTAHDGHEINEGQENGIHLAGQGLAPAELGLEEEHENGQHGVVAKALTGVGECQGE